MNARSSIGRCSIPVAQVTLSALLVAPAGAAAEPSDICTAISRNLPADLGETWGVGGLAGPELGERLAVPEPWPEVTAGDGDWLDLERFHAWLERADWLAPEMKQDLREVADYGGANLYRLDSQPPLTVLGQISGSMHCQTLLLYAEGPDGRAVQWETPGGEPGDWCYSAFLHPVVLDGAPALIGRSDSSGQTTLEVYPLPTTPEAAPACGLAVTYHDVFRVEPLHCGGGDCEALASLLAGEVEEERVGDALLELPPPEATARIDLFRGEFEPVGQMTLEDGGSRYVVELGELQIGWRVFDGYGARLYRLSDAGPRLAGLFLMEHLNGAIQEVETFP